MVPVIYLKPGERPVALPALHTKINFVISVMPEDFRGTFGVHHEVDGLGIRIGRAHYEALLAVVQEHSSGINAIYVRGNYST